MLNSIPADVSSIILYNFCNIIAIVAKRVPDHADNELTTQPEERIAGKSLLQSLTHYFPSTFVIPYSHADNEYVLNLLFSPFIISLFPLPSIASPYLDTYTDSSLLRYFFPYLQQTVLLRLFSHHQIGSMSVAGVSGNEDDQDVINFLRDLAVLLLSSTHTVNFDVGFALFQCLLLAMRHGYIETERFPELTAKVINFYAVKRSTIPAGMVLNASIHDSISWIRGIFANSDDRHRDMRAIKEVVCVVLGMKETEASMNVSVDPEVSEAVMEVRRGGICEG